MLNRLEALEENLTTLKQIFHSASLQQVQSDKTIEWSIRYGLLESIQIVIDVSCHLVGKFNLGNPSTYAECIELLHKQGYLNETLTIKLVKMVGLRNLLIHKYFTIDIEKIYKLRDRLGDFAEFAQAVEALL